MTDVAITMVPPETRARACGLETTPSVVDLFHALTADAALAVHSSGGGLYLAFPAAGIEPDDDDPGGFAREIRDSALPADTDVPLLEVTGTDGDFDAAVLRELRERSEAASVAVLDASVACVERTHLDTAAMRLRREEVTLGPTPGGGWWYCGTSLESGSLPNTLGTDIATVATSFAEADRSVGFLPHLPRVNTESHRSGLESVVGARRATGRSIAPYTEAWMEQYAGRPRATDTS